VKTVPESSSYSSQTVIKHNHIPSGLVASIQRMALIPRPLLPTRSPPSNSCASSRACKRRLSSMPLHEFHRHCSSNFKRSTSKSVDDLIQAQVASEVKNTLDFPKTIIKYDAQINFHRGAYSLLDPARPEYIPLVTSAVQKRMQGMTSGHTMLPRSRSTSKRSS
jgi:hypothetical protein